MHRAIHCLVVISLAIVAIGCGGDLESSVSGVVSFDGQPLQRGAVTFHPIAGGAAAVGSIGTDGRYEIKTGSSVGLTPGEYGVTVVAAEDPPATAVGQTSLPGKLITPARYGQLETSNLRATVTAGSSEINFDLLP